MNKFLKITKRFLIIVFSIILSSVLYLRFSRFSDKIIYQMSNTNYSEFKSELNHEEFYFDVDTNVKLHGVLFKPDSIKTIGTIFHYSGKGMHLMSSIQKSYEPLLKKGFQIFCFERRDFGKSNSEADNSMTLKKDALFVFDKVLELESVKKTPILIWGQSLGGVFAIINANERQDKIKGLIVEGTFSSFPDIGKVYASALNLENFKWIVPILMNNDFPAESAIKILTIPTLIIHSKKDAQVPYELGMKIYEASNKSNTQFWDIDSDHIMGIYDHEEKYVGNFTKLIE